MNNKLATITFWGGTVALVFTSFSWIKYPNEWVGHLVVVCICIAATAGSLWNMTKGGRK